MSTWSSSYFTFQPIGEKNEPFDPFLTPDISKAIVWILRVRIVKRASGLQKTSGLSPKLFLPHNIPEPLTPVTTSLFSVKLERVAGERSQAWWERSGEKKTAFPPSFFPWAEKFYTSVSQAEHQQNLHGHCFAPSFPYMQVVFIIHPFKRR